MADDDFEEAAAFASEDEARQAAATLIESGIASSVEVVTYTDPETEIEVTAYQLNVLGIQKRRAQEVLEIIEPAHVPTGDDDHAPKLEKGNTSWKAVALIWLIAMITLPAAAFFLTVFLMSK